MNYVDSLELMFKDGVDNLWRSVNAMPEDKIIWRPAEGSRTARELLEELVSTTVYSISLIHPQENPAKESEDKADLNTKTVAELETEHRSAVVEFLKAVAAFPEEKLSETMDLPWGTMSFFQIISYPYWNLVYHWGQIGYIQTMYGDQEMH